jgi:hypothetical protein
MGAWQDCRELELASRQHLREHLFAAMAFSGRYVHVDKGAMAREFQQTQGDYVFNSDNDTAWRIEHKCEYENIYGNLFIETFSNGSAGNPGWFWKLEADYLLYHFIRDGQVLLMRLPELRRWLYSPDPNKNGVPMAHRYSHKVQRSHEQKNDTWGYCVRITDIEAGIKVKHKDVPPLLLPGREAKRNEAA